MGGSGAGSASATFGVSGAGLCPTTASGTGAGARLGACGFFGIGLAGGWGAGGATLGAGGSTNSLIICTGTSSVTTRLSNPLCSAQSSAAWKISTPATTIAVRRDGRVAAAAGQP